MFPAWTRPIASLIQAVSDAIAAANTYVKRTGDSMTGLLSLGGTTGSGLRITSSVGRIYFGSGSDATLQRTSAGILTVVGGLEIDSGASGARPTASASQEGTLFFDTTLGKVIVWNGTAWVNVDGSAL